MLIVTDKRVTAVTFAVFPIPLFLFFRMAVMGQSDLMGRNSELGGLESPQVTFPSGSVSPSMAGN